MKWNGDIWMSRKIKIVLSKQNLIWSIFSDRITCAPWRLKVRKHVGSWSLGVTLCWVTVRSEWTTNCARGGMDAALGLDAIVAPTSSCEEGSWVVMKNKGLCISEPKEIQYCFSWTGLLEYVWCVTQFGGCKLGLRGWRLSRLGSKQKSFNLSKRNLNFIFSCRWPAHPSSSLWTSASWQLLGLKNLGR